MLLWFGLAPWLFCLEVAIYLGMVVLVEMESYGLSLTLILAGLIASHFLHVFSMVDLIKNHFMVTLVCVLGYFPSGTIWGVFKWFLFLHRFNDARKVALDEFHDDQEAARTRARNGNAYATDSLLLNRTDREHLSGGHYKNTSLSKAPRIRDYRGKVVGWICFWVFSIVGTIFHDLARRISMWIYNRISGFLQWMSNKVVGDIPEPIDEKVTDDAKP
jgi:hypothetical protein